MGPLTHERTEALCHIHHSLLARTMLTNSLGPTLGGAVQPTRDLNTYTFAVENLRRERQVLLFAASRLYELRHRAVRAHPAVKWFHQGVLTNLGR